MIGRPWRLSTSAHGPVVLLERELPRQRRLVGVGRAHHVHVRRGAQVGQLLDRLVGRAVLAQADRVVGEDVDHRQVHQRRQAHRALHVVEEVEERGAERAQPVAVEPVHDRAHAVLAHAVVHVAPGVVVARDRAAVVDQRERGGLEVGRAADQVRDLLRGPLDHLLRGLAGGDRVVGGVEARQVGVPAVGQPAVHHQRQLGPQLGVLGAVGLGALVPLLLGLARRAPPPPRGSARATSSGTRKWASGSQP